jgi:hypothetical protein
MPLDKAPSGSAYLWTPGRSWSLLEMYEFKLRFLDTIMGLVRREEAKYQRYAVDPPELPPSKMGLFGFGALIPLPEPKPAQGFFGGAFEPKNALVQKPAPSPWVHDELIAKLKEDLSFIDHFAGMLEMRGSVDRVKMFEEALAFMPTYETCHQEWRALRGHMEKELNERMVVYVGRLNGAHLALMDHDWGPAFFGFPSMRPEVERGLKCFAYEQFTACVFHMMRVAEQGLRGIAREQRIKLPKDRPIDEADWGTLTTRLKTALERVNNWPAKKASKKDALGYYTGVHADVVFFKDRYRNIVSHSLTTFDEPDANRVITRVCDFMNTVSSRTDEAGKRIAWK